MSHVNDSARNKSGIVPTREFLYELIHVDEGRLEEILDLQELIVTQLDDPDLFHPGSISFIKEHIQKKGRIIGISSGNRLIGYRVLSFPGSDPDNLGIDLSVPKTELSRVAHLEIFAVHPDYRGNTLQLKTLPSVISILRDFGYEHVCATVSPKNYPGLNNLLKGRFVIKGLKEKYGGKLRYILYQNLAQPISRVSQETITLLNTDIQEQKRALARGYYGYEMLVKPEGLTIRYGK